MERSANIADPDQTAFSVTVTLKEPKLKTHVVELANSVDPDEAAHDELPHLDIHCFLSESSNSQ